MDFMGESLLHRHRPIFTESAGRGGPLSNCPVRSTMTADITELEAATAYDCEVRARNAAGAGPAASASATPRLFPA